MGSLITAEINPTLTRTSHSKLEDRTRARSGAFQINERRKLEQNKVDEDVSLRIE
jgi:hypothetical protein